ncbi:MAG: hypothetical protein ACYC0C_16810 [Devosia sp.]
MLIASKRKLPAIGTIEDWSDGGTVNLIEEPMTRAEGPDLRPFELRSWKLVRG